VLDGDVVAIDVGAILWSMPGKVSCSGPCHTENQPFPKGCAHPYALIARDSERNPELLNVRFGLAEQDRADENRK
jgi:hypothetical protein